MENIITGLINALFQGVDERNWEKVISIFDAPVFLDYSSMTGIPPSAQSPRQIVNAWADFLPGFDKTNHQLTDFRIKKKGNLTTVTFEGKADHFIGNSVWTVEGDYYLEIKNNNRVSLMKFNYKKQSGDTELPKKATGIMQNRNQ